MYHRGHEQGTRRQSHTQSAWFAVVEEENIRRIDAEYAAQVEKQIEQTQEEAE